MFEESGNRRSVWGLWLSLAATGGLGAAACAPLDEENAGGEVTTVQAAATTTVLITGSVRDNSAAKLPVPGVVLNLSGAATHSAISNSNGVYQFNVPAGTYTVKVSKSGASFSPSTTGSFSTTKNIEKSFTCLAGCEGAATVQPFKELVIVDPIVVGNSRAQSVNTTAPWSFRFMMEQMTPAGVDPADFVLGWLQGFRASAGPINGFAVEDRAVDLIIGPWPRQANGKLDLFKAPFRLLAIVNRTDLHADGVGEARFVYGLRDDNNNGQRFTVIFEYRLPTTIPRNDWVKEFHALGALGFGSTFNSKLQTLTDKFTRAGTSPGNPNGSSISQVRTNEIQLGGPWQMREFHLVKDASGKGFLKLATVAQTPNPTLNNTSGVANYITANALRIKLGLATVPNNLIGGQSDEVAPWSFPSFPAVTEASRHSFAAQTCNGCHNGETAQIDLFYQITPLHTLGVGENGTELLSDFIKNVEVTRRRRFMQNRLVCSSSADCSPGAEAQVF